MDADVSMFMDTSQDFESSPGGVVRWVASQSPNPALQALMNEAERDRRTRPSTPVHEPMSWTYPLTSATSSTSLSASVASPWQSSGHSSLDLLPLSGSSSASSLSLAPRVSEPLVSRRATPLSAAQRLASSTSSVNPPPRHSARPRASSHSTVLPNPSTSKQKYIPQDKEPEAITFIDLLKVTSKNVDKNSTKKQHAALRGKKGREQSLGRSGIDNHTGLDAHKLSAYPLVNTPGASAICPVKSSTKAPEKTLGTTMSAYKPEPRGRALEKTASLGAPGAGLVSGKSTPTSLPSPNLNCNPKLVPAPRLLTQTSNISNTIARKKSFPEPTSNNGDSTMQDTIDLTETDTEWEKATSGPILRADATIYMKSDDEDSDVGMDVSFFKPDPPPQTHVAVPKPKLQPPHPNSASRLPTATPRSRAGPPPLGMRRAPHLQPSQYSSTQGSKGVTRPRFKPPLLANAGGATNQSGGGSKPAATTSSKRPPRGGATKLPVAAVAARTGQDADSSFDVSFDVDADALEEAMKAYD
ncbi:hypothetical protein HD554DRAFT_2039505 [Boletus coccyginus]|nr:hypothetical protein HD554DRAFT_2039505 [Boletus coccyginus]